LPCPVAFPKIFPFPLWPNQIYIPRRPTPLEGRIAIVTDAGRDAVDAAASGTQRESQGEMNLVSDKTACGRQMLFADGKAVWSWHPLLVSSQRRQVGPDRVRQNLNPPMTVTRRIRSPGRARNKPLKPLRAGMPGDLGWTCGDYARVLHLNSAREAMGAAGTRHSPRPLFFRANGSCTPRAQRAAGMRSRIRNCLAV
jgi:hypothetical protein